MPTLTHQRWQQIHEQIRADYLEARRTRPEAFEATLNLSWSNWGFGIEPLSQSVRRLADYGVSYIELHGNRYGPDLGYTAAEVRTVLADHGVRATGICGMFSPDNDLASNRPLVRQAAIDYIRRNVELGQELGVEYFLIVPAAVGRPRILDTSDLEFHRSAETLRSVADVFSQAGIQGAIEPIRSAEVSIVHTFAEAVDYINAVDHPAVQHINGDVYHMLVEETNIAGTIVEYDSRLLNLHLADTHRGALGSGSLDLDALIMALYLIGFNRAGRYCTPEPLGPGGDPYPAMYGRPDSQTLDRLVRLSVEAFREREEVVRSL